MAGISIAKDKMSGSQTFWLMTLYKNCSVWLDPLIFFRLSIVIWSTIELFLFSTSQMVSSRSMFEAQKTKSKDKRMFLKCSTL